MSSRYDLITVGGGMAASALAKCLAESGAKVLVLEQETRFRDRIRGEYMMPWGVAEIAALGIYELLCKECAQKIPWIDLAWAVLRANSLPRPRSSSPPWATRIRKCRRCC